MRRFHYHFKQNYLLVQSQKLIFNKVKLKNKNVNLLQHVTLFNSKFINWHGYFFDKKLGKLYNKVRLFSHASISLASEKVVCPNNHLAVSGTETAINYRILLYVMSFSERKSDSTIRTVDFYQVQ